MGYEAGKGLGKNLQGIQAPVEAFKRKGKAAVGFYGSERTKTSLKHFPQHDSEEEEDKEFQKNLQQWKKPVEVCVLHVILFCLHDPFVNQLITMCGINKLYLSDPSWIRLFGDYRWLCEIFIFHLPVVLTGCVSLDCHRIPTLVLTFCDSFL